MEFQNPIKVIKYDENTLFKERENDMSSIRLSQESMVMSDSGVLNDTTRSCFCLVPTRVAKALKEGQVLPGNIYRRDSFTPFYSNQKAVQNPSTKEDALKQGRKYFMQYLWDPKGLKEDAWITPEVEQAAVSSSDVEQVGEQDI